VTGLRPPSTVTVEPYYTDDAVTLFHGDCREVLPTLDLTAVDLVMADPPYGETSLDWDVPVRDWLPLVEQVGYLWCFGSLRMFMGQAAAFSGWRFSQDVAGVDELVWEKHNGSNFAADRFKRVHELAALFYRGRWDEHYHQPVTTPTSRARRVTYRPDHDQPVHTGKIGRRRDYQREEGGPLLMRSVIYAASCHGAAIHPTQKPEAVVGPLVAYGCPPGGTVLDPFAGSATTLRVAKDRGRRAIGIELDEAMCEQAARRLAQEVLAL